MQEVDADGMEGEGVLNGGDGWERQERGDGLRGKDARSDVKFVFPASDCVLGDWGFFLSQCGTHRFQRLKSFLRNMV